MPESEALRRRKGPSVLVVGAGPVGLAAALELARRGARVRITDVNESRAGRATRSFGRS